MFLVAALFAIPFLWSVSTSFRTLADTLAGFSLLPRHWTTSGYHEAFHTFNFGRFMLNSAIIATQGAIEADDEDSSFAIAAILALGALSLFTFPVVGHYLHLSDHAYGLWAGLAVDNTAEATAAGALYSDAAGKLAVLAKTTRNAMIGFVVLAYAIYWASRGQAKTVGNKAAFLWQKFPEFVLGFLLISVLATYHFFSKDQTTAIANLSRWAFLLTFAGVGLRTSNAEW